MFFSFSSRRQRMCHSYMRCMWHAHVACACCCCSTLSFCLRPSSASLRASVRCCQRCLSHMPLSTPLDGALAAGCTTATRCAASTKATPTATRRWDTSVACHASLGLLLRRLAAPSQQGLSGCIAAAAPLFIFLHRRAPVLYSACTADPGLLLSRRRLHHLRQR